MRALVALHRGDTARAAAEVRRGLAELGSYQSGFGSLDLRTASAVHGLPLARLGLELARAQRQPGGVLRGAWSAAGRSPSGWPASAPPRDERTADLLAALRRPRRRPADLEGDPAAGEELARLRSRIAGLQRDIRARAWELEGGAGAAGRPDSARVAEVRAAAPASSAPRSSATSCTAAGGRRCSPPPAGRGWSTWPARPRSTSWCSGSAPTWTRWRCRCCRRRCWTPYDARSTPGLRRLDDLLLAPLGVDGTPLRGLVPARRWCCCRGACCRRGAGLPVVVTPERDRLAARGRASAACPPRVVAVAGPGLHRAEDEAPRVRALWPGAALLTGDAATTAPVREALAGADVVHVAAHGTHQQESPLFSSLRVADGPLYAYELDADGRGGPVRGAVRLRGGAGDGAPRRRGARADQRAAAPRVAVGAGRGRPGAGRRRRAGDGAACTGRWLAGTDSAAALATALAEEEQAPFVAFGATW